MTVDDPAYYFREAAWWRDAAADHLASGDETGWAGAMEWADIEQRAGEEAASSVGW